MPASISIPCSTPLSNSSVGSKGSLIAWGSMSRNPCGLSSSGALLPQDFACGHDGVASDGLAALPCLVLARVYEAERRARLARGRHDLPFGNRDFVSFSAARADLLVLSGCRSLVSRLQTC